MASPQREHGYTAIANELLERIVWRRFHANELAVILWIARKSYGWNSKATNPIGVRHMAEEMKAPKSNVMRAIKCLLKARVIIRDDRDRYGINKDYESWVVTASINSDPPMGQQAAEEVSHPRDESVPPMGQSVPPMGHDRRGVNDKANHKTNLKQPSEAAVVLTGLLIELLRKNDPLAKIPANLHRWQTEADRLLGLDGRPLEDAKKVLAWCQADDFWKANILSMPKFRQKYPNLKLRMEAQSGTKGNFGQGSNQRRSPGLEAPTPGKYADLG